MPRLLGGAGAGCSAERAGGACTAQTRALKLRRAPRPHNRPCHLRPALSPQVEYQYMTAMPPMPAAFVPDNSTHWTRFTRPDYSYQNGARRMPNPAPSTALPHAARWPCLLGGSSARGCLALALASSCSREVVCGASRGHVVYRLLPAGRRFQMFVFDQCLEWHRHKHTWMGELLVSLLPPVLAQSLLVPQARRHDGHVVPLSVRSAAASVSFLCRTAASFMLQGLWMLTST